MKTKNVKSNFVAITLAIMLTIGFSNLTFAQQGRGNGNGQGQNYKMHQKGEQRCLNLPDITEEQQKKIKELHLKNMKSMLPIRNEMREKQASLKTLTTKEKVDMTAVNAKVDEIAVLKNKMMKLRIANQQEIRKLLTEEQRLIFDTRPHMKGHRDGHGNGNGQGIGRGHGNGYGNGNGYHRDCPYGNKTKK